MEHLKAQSSEVGDDDTRMKDLPMSQPSQSRSAARIAVSQATTPALDQSHQSKGSHTVSGLLISTMNMDRNRSAVDQAPVRPTKSLVKLYETKEDPKPKPSATESIRYVQKPSLGSSSKAPKPVPLPRSSSSTSVLPGPRPHLSAQISSRSQAKPVPPMKPASLKDPGAATKAPPSSTMVIARDSHKAPLPPPPRRSQRALDSAQGKGGLRDMMSLPPTSHLVEDVPILSTPTTTQPRPPPPPSRTNSQPVLHSEPSPSPPRTVHEKSLSSRRPTRLSIDSLANAMVASSLASSRASSPSKPTPPPPRRRSSHRQVFQLGGPHKNSSGELTLNRTPSPVKTLRQTMREPPKSDPELVEHKKKKGQWGRHPNKHHEGDRKRYRMTITERERKRYEGVWAANRGLLLPPVSGVGTVNGDVLNIVVRDIWKRSRLPDTVLEEVYDLVNMSDSDRLGKEEFVVGMWLIDQSLKGNKLPIKVPESVWSSVKTLSGLKVRGP